MSIGMWYDLQDFVKVDVQLSMHGVRLIYEVILLTQARNYFLSEALVKTCSGMSAFSSMDSRKNSVPFPLLSSSLKITWVGIHRFWMRLTSITVKVFRSFPLLAKRSSL